MQAVFNPTTYDESHLVPDIIEQHKLYFNPCIISLMLMSGPPLHLTRPTHQPDTWDVHPATKPSMCNINQSMCDELKVPITNIDDVRINYCTPVGDAHLQCHIQIGGGGDSWRQECLRTFCRGLYSQPDLKRLQQLSVK